MSSSPVKKFFGNPWVFYKYMAFLVGTALVSATIALVLRHTTNPEFASATWYAKLWMAHGYLYMVYLIATFNLSIKRNWKLVKMLLVMLAGTVPFMSFIAEARLAKEVQ
ncbi:MAG: DUF3817 domain-containing protein [Actinobacteria bacterium]|nr:DUF3817 domain-containing protein [Actinomycetota bacterium]